MTHRLVLAAAAAAPVLLLCAASSATAASQNPWEGFYVGGNLGGVWGDASAQLSVGSGTISAGDAAAINGATRSGSGNTSGFTGGIEGGYNWVSGALLLGIETDWDFFDISQDASRTANSPLLINPPITYTLSQSVKTDWLWTLRPRIGYAVDNWMVYATVGLAVSDLKNSLHFAATGATPHTVTQDSSDTKTGWIAGLGGAYAFSPEWSVKGEWLYTDFGTVSNTVTSSDGFVTLNSRASVRGNIFRVGVDYRF